MKLSKFTLMAVLAVFMGAFALTGCTPEEGTEEPNAERPGTTDSSTVDEAGSTEEGTTEESGSTEGEIGSTETPTEGETAAPTEGETAAPIEGDSHEGHNHAPGEGH